MGYSLGNQSVTQSNAFLRCTASLGSEAGVSLIGVMMAIGISGILAVAATQLMHNMQKSVTSGSLETERIGLIDQLRGSIDCDKTFSGIYANPTTSCALNPYLPLINRFNSTLVALGGSTIGSWEVRARCSPDGFEVRVARLTTAAKSNSEAWLFTTTTASLFKTDALNVNKVMSWQWNDTTPGRKNVIIKKAGVCGSKFAPTAVAPACPAGSTCTYHGSAFDIVTVQSTFYGPGVTCGPAIPNCTGYRYGAVVACPTNYVVTGGGGHCEFTSNGGFQLRSLPQGNSWNTECCATQCPGWTQVASPLGFATCVKMVD